MFLVRFLEPKILSRKKTKKTPFFVAMCICMFVDNAKLNLCNNWTKHSGVVVLVQETFFPQEPTWGAFRD